MRIELSTITPLFIGAGTDKVYLTSELLVKGNTAYRISLSKLLEENMDLVEEVAKSSDIRGGIEQLLNKLEARKDEKHAIYEIKLPANTSSRISSPRQVKEFMKDVNYVPYIPGSSLKGYIRTAFVWSILQNNSSAYMRLESLIERYVQNRKELPKYVQKYLDILLSLERQTKFDEKESKYDPQKDLLKLLILRDMRPVNYTLLLEEIRIEKVNRSRSRRGNFLVECVEGTFEGEMLIAPNFDVVRNKYKKEFDEVVKNIFGEKVEKEEFINRTLKIVKEFTNFVIKNDHHFEMGDMELKQEDDKVLVRLGAHTSILYKTILSIIKDRNSWLYEQLVRNYWRRSAYNWRKFPLSIKLTSSNQPVGWCALKTE